MDTFFRALYRMLFAHPLRTPTASDNFAPFGNAAVVEFGVDANRRQRWLTSAAVRKSGTEHHF